MKRCTAFGSFFALVLGVVAGAQPQTVPRNRSAQFVGSKTCGTCYTEIYTVGEPRSWPTFL